jgi:transformation/transcription domain-associated protein
MLADLLHHVRAELDSTQLRRTIAIYSANLHDESLAPSIQTMCAKLLLNLIDRIIKLPDLKEGMTQLYKELILARVMLLSILDTFKVKFEELNRSFPRQKDEDAMDEDSELTMREVSERRPIKTLIQSSENPPDPIKGIVSVV